MIGFTPFLPPPGLSVQPCTSRWALAFSRSKSTFSDGEGPGAAPENTYTKYPPKMRNFRNFPYDFPKNLHAAPYR